MHIKIFLMSFFNTFKIVFYIFVGKIIYVPLFNTETNDWFYIIIIITLTLLSMLGTMYVEENLREI